jgi:hypothetical protein
LWIFAMPKIAAWKLRLGRLGGVEDDMSVDAKAPSSPIHKKLNGLLSVLA